MSNLNAMKNEESSSSDDSDVESDSDDESSDQPVLQIASIPHYGTINRIRVNLFIHNSIQYNTHPETKYIKSTDTHLTEYDINYEIKLKKLIKTCSGKETYLTPQPCSIDFPIRFSLIILISILVTFWCVYRIQLLTTKCMLLYGQKKEL